MAGEMATLNAGAGGAHVSTTGGASLRTPKVSVELESTGDATVASRGTLDVSARELKAGGRSVKVEAKGPAVESKTVTMGLSCGGTTGVSCETLQDSLDGGVGLEELAAKLVRLFSVSFSVPSIRVLVLVSSPFALHLLSRRLCG